MSISNLFAENYLTGSLITMAIKIVRERKENSPLSQSDNINLIASEFQSVLSPSEQENIQNLMKGLDNNKTFCTLFVSLCIRSCHFSNLTLLDLCHKRFLTDEARKLS